ncbi:MAG TPA: M48 family metalloprotease [Casimicrobiaceae bacterium]|nr:M48 family metalloprotease [Casimicrobiaceae bacterium]
MIVWVRGGIAGLLLLIASATFAQSPAIDPEALASGSEIAYRRALAPFAAARKLNADREINVRVRRVANRIIAGATTIDPTATRYSWAVNIVNDPTPSILIYPLGRIVVHDGIVTFAGFADDEIAAVFAHMVAHSLLGHDASRIASGAGSSMTSPDPNRRAIAVADAATELIPRSRYSADEIDAADRASVSLMARAGYDPRAAGSAWRRLRGTRGVIERAPVSDERLANLDAMARESVAQYDDARARLANQPVSQPLITTPRRQ